MSERGRLVRAVRGSARTASGALEVNTNGRTAACPVLASLARADEPSALRHQTISKIILSIYLIVLF